MVAHGVGHTDPCRSSHVLTIDVWRGAQFVEEGDLEEMGFKKLQKRHFLAAVQEL